jgi:hypothetical protein
MGATLLRCFNALLYLHTLGTAETVMWSGAQSASYRTTCAREPVSDIGSETKVASQTPARDVRAVDDGPDCNEALAAHPGGPFSPRGDGHQASSEQP